MQTSTDETLALPHREVFAPRPLAAGIVRSVAAVFVVCLGCVVLARSASLLPSVIDWDESLYAVMAQHWLQGELPYAAVWDQHSVGLPAIFAAILFFFPKSIVALRLSACVAVAVTSTALYFTGRLIDRRPWPAFVTVFLYIAWTTRLWGFSANTELYIEALIAPALYSIIRLANEGVRNRRDIAFICLSALSIGIAVQVKHVIVAETVLFFAATFLSRNEKRPRPPAWVFVAAVACFLMPTIVAIGYFAFSGLIGVYFSAVVEANLSYMVARPTFVDVWPGFPKTFFFQAVIVATSAFLILRMPERRIFIVLCWAMAAVIDALLPGQFWAHYFLLLLPASALLMAWLAALFTDMGPRVAKLALPIVLLVLAYPLGIVQDVAKARTLAERDVPSLIAARITPELTQTDSIFVFNYQPIIYFLSDARLPTRHVLPADWSKQYRTTTGVEPMVALESVFSHRPKYVVFIDRDWQHMGMDVLAALHRHLAVAYSKDFEIVDEQILSMPAKVEVYRRN
jgi:hypothetical protein